MKLDPRSVPCIVCDAKVGEFCLDTVGNKVVTMVESHQQRIALAQRMPCLPSDLDATDKALIVYYAYVMLCDSVGTKSKELFGKQFSSRDVQAFFARKAIEELRKDGLIK